MERTAIIMISNRHIHLTREAVDVLFGKGYELTVKKELGYPIFAANETVTLVGPKGSIAGVRVLGPLRPYNQAEILRADCFVLGIRAPVAISGTPDIAPVRVVGPAGALDLEHGAVVAKRHLHISAENAEKYGLRAGQIVRVRIGGERGLVFDQTVVVITEMETTVHVDVEEGNAANVTNGDVVEILV
ncbi:MAG: PduL/EutD family phosphate acyltransferase [Oscillospiraceae bacterium]|nr:PduL/EutD family phosphate acyltransferase [Oscillospiraceae bacterium]